VVPASTTEYEIVPSPVESVAPRVSPLSANVNEVVGDQVENAWFPFPITKLNVEEDALPPPVLEAVMAKAVEEDERGVPEITPVDESIDRPAGSDPVETAKLRAPVKN
jgi:hypothetical protein